MKRNLLVVGSLMAVLVGGLGFTQTIAEARGGADCRFRQGDGRHEGSGKRLALMAEILGLSAEQKTRIAAIHQEERERIKPLREKMRETRKQLRDVAKAKPFDEEKVRLLAASQADVKTELTVSRLRAQNRISAVLTPEQQELAEKIRPLFRDHHRRGHRGPGF